MLTIPILTTLAILTRPRPRPRPRPWNAAAAADRASIPSPQERDEEGPHRTGRSTYAEREKAAADAAAYIDPALSEKAREEGNALFKAGDFAAAVKSYTESIKRDPKDPRGYNNRALCYTKLAALPEALKDTESAIQVDPNFGTLMISLLAML